MEQPNAVIINHFLRAPTRGGEPACKEAFGPGRGGPKEQWPQGEVAPRRGGPKEGRPEGGTVTRRGGPRSDGPKEG